MVVVGSFLSNKLFFHQLTCYPEYQKNVFLFGLLNVNDENEISKILIKYDKKYMKKKLMKQIKFGIKSSEG